MEDDAEYITADQAAEVLRVSSRQVHRYAEGNNPRLRVRKAGRRLLFHAGDVDQLALDLNVAHRPRPRPSAVRMMPQGELAQYLKQKDEEIAQLREEIAQRREEIARLQTAMQAQKELYEKEMKLRLLEVERTAQAPTRQPPGQAKPPFWRRLLGGGRE